MLVRSARVYRLGPVGCLAEDLELGIGVEHPAQAIAYDRVVVDDQQADRRQRRPLQVPGPTPSRRLHVDAGPLMDLTMPALAGAVRAEDRKDLALFDAEGNMVDGDLGRRTA